MEDICSNVISGGNFVWGTRGTRGGEGEGKGREKPRAITRQIPGHFAEPADSMLRAFEEVAPVCGGAGEVGLIEDLEFGKVEAVWLVVGFWFGVFFGGRAGAGLGDGVGESGGVYGESPADPEGVACINDFVAAAVEAGQEEGGGGDGEGSEDWLQRGLVGGVGSGW